MKKILTLAIILLSAMAAYAQMPVIHVPNSHNTNYQERTLCYIVDANIDYTVSTDVAWAHVRKGSNNSVYIHLDQNITGDSRMANVAFRNDAIGVNQVMTITQTRDESVEEAPVDTYIRPSSASDNSHQGSESIAQSYDRDYNSLYHSAYSGFNVSRSNPAILTYNFKDVSEINYVIYHPRPSGENGRFGEIEVLLKHEGESNYTSYGEFDFKKASGASVINFSDEVNKKITSVQFKVYSGGGNFASCAEMEFYAFNKEAQGEYAIFGDDIYSTLREGVQKSDIDALENPFVKSLATQLYEGNYKTEYRVANYECFTHYEVLSELWNAPGKYYDQQNGVTGINICKGKHAIVVSGIPEGDSNVEVGLRVIAWYTGHTGEDGDTGGPETYNFALRNGLNIINYNGNWDGLAYVRYYARENVESYKDIRVHFVNGQINGYLCPEKTNKEMHEITANAVNKCIDVYGRKVHSIWTAQGLHDYCKASDNKSLGYRQYMNILDSLIQWEHRSLGFEKYNRIPKNRTMAYVNWSYYMFQGGYGVSFHVNQERRVLNCQTLMQKDDDAIWGLSHEWGHQHQMHPYFCWAGMSEITNNVQSYYNITHMGYRTSDKITSWPGARKHFINDDLSDIKKMGDCTLRDGKLYSNQRNLAYQHRTDFNWNSKLLAVCTAMKDSMVYNYAEKPGQALQQQETGVGEGLFSFIMLNNYFVTEKGYTDFSADWYEALRQNDEENGSVIEPGKTTVDKYELLASAQNENKNGKLAVFRKSYPQSCWTKNNYITEAHCGRFENSVPYMMNFIRKASRLTGYNLTPFFERMGYLRYDCALYIGDYGNKWYVCAKDMYDEFVADMNELGLKECDEEMVIAISKGTKANSNGDNFMTGAKIPNE